MHRGVIIAWKIRERGEELFHHIYAWGNDRHPVFKDRLHYNEYLSLLEIISREYAIEVIAYALMEWHVHLFIYDRNNEIADFIMSLHGEYAQFFNRACQRTGHIFGERYNNKIVSNSIYAKWLSRYIHRQALKAGLIDDPAKYPWTSYNRYIGTEKQGFIKCNHVLDMFGPEPDQIKSYKEFVLDTDEGPVDWGHRIFKIRSRDYFINMMANEFAVETKIITKPHSLKEKALRKEAALLLMGKYGLNNVQTAMILGISHSAIAKYIKTIK